MRTNTSKFRLALTSLTLVALLLLVLGAAPVRAQTTWYVDDDCLGNGDGTQLDAFCTIQDAIDAAGPGDTIVVAAGTYTDILGVLHEARVVWRLPTRQAQALSAWQALRTMSMSSCLCSSSGNLAWKHDRP